MTVGQSCLVTTVYAKLVVQQGNHDWIYPYLVYLCRVDSGKTKSADESIKKEKLQNMRVTQKLETEAIVLEGYLQRME